MPGANSGTYYWKGKTEKIKKLAVTVQALEHGELVPHTETLYYSNYGPVFWDSKLPIAVADANATNLRGPDQWLAISKAEDAAQVIEAERTIQGVPWVNTIGADDQGNAFYTEIAVASDLTKAFVSGSCNLSPGSLIGHYIDEPACEPPESAGAIAPGNLTGDEEPALVRAATSSRASNNSFWLANPNARSPDSPPPSAGARKKTRACALRQGDVDVLGRPAGMGAEQDGGVPTDGLSSTPGFTAETMQASSTTFRSLAAERALPGAARNLRGSGSAKTAV